MKSLKDIFDKHACDKGTIRHRYDRVYAPVFEELRNDKINILEVGIFKGTSLKAHLEYFSIATVYAIDIFGRVPANNVPVLKNERVKWCKCDSVESPNLDFFNMVGDIKFDIIIDDGLHTHDSQRCTFENFMPYLTQGGKYFIEDVWAFNHMSSVQKKHPWLQKNKNGYSEAKYACLMDVLKPYNVLYHDLRKNYEPDTFIIEISK